MLDTRTFVANSATDLMSQVSDGMEGYIQEFISTTRDFVSHALYETDTEEEVCECLEKKRFHFISQGIFDESGDLKKTELLARLEGSDGKTLSPAVFCPIIEKRGLCTIFDYLVLEKAFEQIFCRSPLIPCSININPSTFDTTFIEEIDRLYERYHINPSQIIFEVLETEEIDDYTEFNKTLSELRKRGYKIAVDDFHPLGNHNVISIGKLGGIDTVKIDGEYTKGLYDKDNTKWTISDFLSNIGHIKARHPGIDIVVEKIEDEKMFGFFQKIFTHFDVGEVTFQGYYFDRGSNF